MNADSKNPFANPSLNSLGRSTEALHSSDHPGREYAAKSAADRYRSSGPGGPSEPRRPGSGERQAPRRQSEGDGPPSGPVIPGEIIFAVAGVEINAGQPVTTLTVENTADRPIQVGSHFHFAEVNAGLEFDRAAAWGKRLNVLSGGSVRFEPGAAEEVDLVPIRGQRIVAGLRGLCGGKLDG